MAKSATAKKPAKPKKSKPTTTTATIIPDAPEGADVERQYGGVVGHMKRDGIDGDMVVKARRALDNAKRMAVGMQSVATAIAKKPIKLTVTSTVSTSMTDGETIYIKPLLELGSEVTHERKLCGVRDPETETQLCGACRRLDSLMSSLFHE